MTAFVVNHTPNTGPGYFLTGDEAQGFGGTYRLAEASKFKTKEVAEKVARNYGAVETENTVLEQTGESIEENHMPITSTPSETSHRRTVLSRRFVGHLVYASLDCGHEKHERDTPFSFTATQVMSGEKLICWDCSIQAHFADS